MIKFKDYKHVFPVQIRFSDIDILNHVNNACYHNYIELGRINYFDAVLGKLVDWNKNGFMLVRTEIDHTEQIYLNDEIFCLTKVVRIGNKSVAFENSIVKRKNGELTECAAVKAVLVAMDYKSNKSIVVPESWREKFGNYEGVTF